MQVRCVEAKWSLSLFALFIVLDLPVQAQETVAATDVVTPLVATPLAAPNPVLGADDKTHLAYEIVLTNIAPSTVSIEKVETLDADSGAVLGTLEGDSLKQMLRLNVGGNGTELPGGGGGFLFMDVTLPKDAAIPMALKHRFDLNVTKPPAQTSSSDHDPSPEPPQDLVFVSDALPVEAPAVVVAPPLKGKHWVVGGGCCTPYSYHRGATLPINGAIHVAERFAIDFVQLNDKNMLFDGDMKQVSDYAYFGDEIYSAADGTVVAIENDLPEQVPGKLPEGATIQMAGAITRWWTSVTAAMPSMRICSRAACA
ncbi:MAG TPA: hypothetical protein VHK26_14440 [Methyloceanibacter sp.]|jgi:hypothetical protein|nr:hypothetical protein [Methyloceanibacter sp.]